MKHCLVTTAQVGDYLYDKLMLQRPNRLKKTKKSISYEDDDHSPCDAKAAFRGAEERFPSLQSGSKESRRQKKGHCSSLKWRVPTRDCVRESDWMEPISSLSRCREPMYLVEPSLEKRRWESSVQRHLKEKESLG